MFSGKADKITVTLQFREIICNSVLSTFPAAFLPRAFVAEGSYMVISISKQHCLLKAEAWRMFSSSAAFPGQHQLALGGRRDNHHGGLQAEKVPLPHPSTHRPPRPCGEGLVCAGKGGGCGAQPSETQQKHGAASTAGRGSPKRPSLCSLQWGPHPPTSSPRGAGIPGGSQLWGG